MFVRDAQAQTPPPGQTPDLHTPPAEPPMATAVGLEHEPETAAGGFAPLDSEFFASQLLWLAITFGALYFIMSRVLAPRIGTILENRRERIALDLDAAERMRFDADAAQAAYEGDLASARERSQSIGQAARDSARADADAERRRNEAELDEKLDAAQIRIAEIKDKALADVDAIAEETAQAILGVVAGLDVSRDEVAAAVRQAHA